MFMAAAVPIATTSIATRVAGFDWPQVAASLDESGWAPLCGLLTGAECGTLTSLYDDERIFRSRVVMARHGYGRGEYKYFAYPLPGLVAELRAALYARLVGVANEWNARLASDVRYPATHAEFIERCHRAGQ